MLTGRVIAFDAAGGWGVVGSGHRGDFGFHATAITSGTRAITVGAVVAFMPVPGHLGRWEASQVTPLDAEREPAPAREGGPGGDLSSSAES